MKQERLNLYRIDIKYIRCLHNIDNRVSSVSPQIGKQHRIYVGLVIICNNRKYLIPLSLKTHPTDPPSEKHYKQLCIDEINWCRKHSDIIINKAHCLYQLCTTKTNYKGKGRCLDFRKLELACDKYNSKYS